MTPAIEYRNVDILFGSRRAEALGMLDSGATRTEILNALDTVVGCADATLTVGEGEISVLMGLSGSGKSTLLRAANGLTRIDRGQVVVRAGGRMVDVGATSEAELRQVRQHAVAMVFQQFGLLPWRTVAENVGFGLELAGVPDAERRRRVMDQLQLVNLTEWADKYGHELSGGMQQRVGLARALATEAPILLMDEPFSALDPLIRTKLQDELLALQSRLHKSILFVSHDFEEALKIGNRITIMDDGRIVQSGTPEEIVLHPANEHVRDFVSNANPLSVLTAANVMLQRNELESSDGWIWLDPQHTTRFRLDDDGRVAAAERNGAEAACSPCEEIALTLPTSSQIYYARPSTPLRTVMRAMHHSQTAPVALFDEARRFVGAIGVREVLSAVVGR